MTTYPRFAVFVLASLALATSACQLPIFFPEVLVNTSDPDYQVGDDVALGEDGEFIVVWTEFPAESEILGRRYDRLTTPLDGPFPISASTTDPQEDASVAKDAEGRFVAVWVEESATIRGRRFEADGTALGESFEVNTSTTNNNFRPHVASDPSGNFVVAWTSTSPTGTEAMARRFDSNGAPLGDEFQVNLFSGGGPHQVGGAAMSPAGFVVSWSGEGEGTTNAIFARLFDAAGNPVTDDLPVTGALETYLPPPDVAMNANGDFVVVWHDGMTTHAVSGRR
ncbi:MAG: hypothetical protein ABW056_07195, partial [Thermoanaerobaculia bacterium]